MESGGCFFQWAGGAVGDLAEPLARARGGELIRGESGMGIAVPSAGWHGAARHHAGHAGVGILPVAGGEPGGVSLATR